MSFTRNIFEEMKAIDPNTTNKSFSFRCGMSEGYYASVTSQGYDLSDEAVINLLEWIEIEKIALGKSDRNGYRKIEKFSAIQKSLANELAMRAHNQRQSSNKHIRSLVLGAFANLYDEKLGLNEGVPFVY